MAGGEPEVLGVKDGFVEQRRDVVIMQRIDHLAPGALSDNEAELAQHP